MQLDPPVPADGERAVAVPFGGERAHRASEPGPQLQLPPRGREQPEQPGRFRRRTGEIGQAAAAQAVPPGRDDPGPLGARAAR